VGTQVVGNFTDGHDGFVGHLFHAADHLFLVASGSGNQRRYGHPEVGKKRAQSVVQLLGYPFPFGLFGFYDRLQHFLVHFMAQVIGIAKLDKNFVNERHSHQQAQGNGHPHPADGQCVSALHDHPVDDLRQFVHQPDSHHQHGRRYQDPGNVEPGLPDQADGNDRSGHLHEYRQK